MYCCIGDRHLPLENSGLLGALSGVKSIMTAYSSSNREDVSTQNQKIAKSLALTVDKYR